MSAKKLEFQALKYIDKHYLQGEEDLEKEKLEKHIKEFSGDVDMERVNEVLQQAISEHEEGDTDMDYFVAKELHKATNLTRREAANPEFWNYLSLLFKPEFVRHRWPSCKKNRFVMRTSTDRHALARLWWIAELTENNSDYRYTKIALSKQDIAQNIFDNDFSHFKNLLPPVLERLDNEPSQVAKKYGEILNRRFAVLLEEDMTKKQLEELAEDVRVRARRELEMEVKDEKRLSKLRNKISRN